MKKRKLVEAHEGLTRGRKLVEARFEEEEDQAPEVIKASNEGITLETRGGHQVTLYPRHIHAIVNMRMDWGWETREDVDDA